MENWSVQHRVFAVEEFIRNGESIVVAWTVLSTNKIVVSTWQPARITPAASTQRKGDCVVCNLQTRNNRALLFWKWERAGSDGELRPVPGYASRIFNSSSWRKWDWRWQHLVSTGRGYSSHGKDFYKLSKNDFPSTLNIPKWYVPYPPRSPDLTPCDFFLWGYLKSKVHVNRPTTIQELKEAIRNEITAIPDDMVQRVMTNFNKRLDECIATEGRHLNDIIFQT